MRFADPLFFLLLALIPLVLFGREWVRKHRRGALRFSDLGRFKRIRPSKSVKLRHSVLVLRLIVLALLVMAAARPQSRHSDVQNDYTEGVDILVALDCSGSMAAMDLDFRKRSRLDVAKDVTADFVEQRSSDRVGLVVFAADAYTQCPMTLDYGVLQEILKSVEITLKGTIEDGTAIGLAVARCLVRLENSQTKSKVIVLLTDGVNNRGEMDPLQAANLAKQLGVKLYTIGAGTRDGKAPILVDSIFGKTWRSQAVQLDEGMLTEMATMTGGHYYRAGDEDELREIFEEINRLETSKIEDLGEHRYDELFIWLAGLALFTLLAEVMLSQTVYRVLP